MSSKPDIPRIFSFADLDRLRGVETVVEGRLLATIDILRKYGNFVHLLSCNVNKQSQWDEAQQALNDTPNEYRDGGVEYRRGGSGGKAPTLRLWMGRSEGPDREVRDES